MTAGYLRYEAGIRPMAVDIKTVTWVKAGRKKETLPFGRNSPHIRNFQGF
jgi:hypothetical protein